MTKEKIPVLIGISHNDIVVPCRIFNCSLEEANKKCEKLFECSGEKKTGEAGNDIYIYESGHWSEKLLDRHSESVKMIHKDMLEAFSKEHMEVEVLDLPIKDGKAERAMTYPSGVSGKQSIRKGWNKAVRDFPDKDLVIVSYQQPIYKTVYLSRIVDRVWERYYGGCGEVYSYKLVEIPFDSVFVGFNLD